MHEMALAESVREIVEETARSSGARRVTAVRLEIGKLAQVEIEAMRFAFEVVKRGSLAERPGSRSSKPTAARGACAARSRWRSRSAASRARSAAATSCRSPAVTACG